MLIVSENLKKLARQAFAMNEIIKTTEDYIIFKMPKGNLEDMSLILFNEGRDADPRKIKTLFFPVEISGRKGYVIPTTAAIAYDS